MAENIQLTFILAMDENNLIGNNNKLPWSLPADLRYFKQQTLHKTILMGRKTCESLPFVLPKRRNIVLTKNINFFRQDFEMVHKLDYIKDLEGEVMVIGGAMIYKLLMPWASKLLITIIHHEFQGDTYFEWNPDSWQVHKQQYYKADKNNPYNYSFMEYLPVATLV
ncbi:Dihydrofolate reductase [hydrothermal vent metagenome]|uniref:dihydrofolate reductase n=1 Tax=hydrothermal vent metagenome TaxID=652676 RepID=A0A3B0VUL2_9ZZZZ